MANNRAKWKDNIPGKFYTDTTCIYCMLCSTIAPSNFRSSEDDDHDFVYKQPANEIELIQCFKAMESCPVSAIGNDGDE